MLSGNQACPLEYARLTVFLVWFEDEAVDKEQGFARLAVNFTRETKRTAEHPWVARSARPAGRNPTQKDD